MLLQANRVHIQQGGRTLLRVERLQLFAGDRIGLVGANGAGKTCLLNLLADPAASGITTHEPVAYIRQLADDSMREPDTGPADFGSHAQTNAATPDPATPRDPAAQALRHMLHVPARAYSGGEQTRARMAEALSLGRGVLLADEPTCNLDLDGVEWLQSRLCAWPGAVVVVSHDRALLEAVCTEIWQISDGELRVFPGTYRDFVAQQALEHQTQQRQYAQARQAKSRLETLVEEKSREAGRTHTTPGRMGNSEARLHKMRGQSQAKKQARAAGAARTRLDQLETVEKPKEAWRIHLHQNNAPPIVSRTAAQGRGIRVTFDGRTVLENVDAALPTDRRTVVMGPNGAGKSTLLKLLGTEQFPLAPGVRIGMYDQAYQSLILEKTALENVLRHTRQSQGDVRTLLATLGLRGEDVHKPAGVLSGGERAKVQLCCLLTGGYSLLALDEPTNHLDLPALEALSLLLAEYTGTLMLVTHDRHLADACAHRLLWVENAKVTTFEHGGYSEFKKSQENKPQTQRAMLALRQGLLSAQLSTCKPKERPLLAAQLEDVEKALRELDLADN